MNLRQRVQVSLFGQQAGSGMTALSRVTYRKLFAKQSFADAIRRATAVTVHESTLHQPVLRLKSCFGRVFLTTTFLSSSAGENRFAMWGLHDD